MLLRAAGIEKNCSDRPVHKCIYKQEKVTKGKSRKCKKDLLEIDVILL